MNIEQRYQSGIIDEFILPYISRIFYIISLGEIGTENTFYEDKRIIKYEIHVYQNLISITNSTIILGNVKEKLTMNTKNIFCYYFFFTFLISGLTIRAQQDELDKLLDLNINDLLNVEIITASKTLQKISDVPATVRVITHEKIQQNGYTTLEDALSDLQGFQFRNIVGFNSYVFQRGIPNQNNLTLLLVDGIQINELNSGGFYGGGQFNLDNVERIEVVYGPASAIYGTNAVTGIINIITKSPKKSQGFESNILYGSFNTLRANAGYRYYNEKQQFGFGISGLYATTNKTDLGGSKGDYNWSEDMENFEDDISVDTKLLYKDFTLGLTFQNKQASATTNYKSVGTHYLDKGSLWNISFFSSYLKHDYNLSESLNLTSQVYFRDATVHDNTIAFVLDSSQVGYYRPNNLLGIEEILSYKISDHISFISGLVYEYEQLASEFSTTTSNSSTSKPPTPSEPDMQRNSLVSFYFQSRFNFLKYFDLYAGFRYDNSSFYDEVFTPRTGLVFKYDKVGAKFLYASAFRAPKPWDYYNGLGNSDLEPEKMRSFEFSISYSLTENSLFEISLYKNLLDDKLSQVYTGEAWYWDNKGETSIDGVELYSEYKENAFQLYANYTYNYSLFDNKSKVLEIAKHSANFGVRYNLTEKFAVGIRNNYLGERTNPQVISSTNDDRIEAALLTHINISYEKFYGFNFRFFVNNLFNTVYYHTSNRTPERYKQPDRSVQFKIEYNLSTN